MGLAAVEESVAAMADAGVKWIQLRLKNATDLERYKVTEACVQRLTPYSDAGAQLWMDDRADLAMLFGEAIAGVHVGQHDLPPEAVRRVVSPECLTGQSCHDVAQVQAADDDDDVDVVAVGPVFETRSKAQPDPWIGLDGVRQARAACSKPMVAIGGIDASNAHQVLDAGADSVVMLGALCRGEGGTAGVGRRSREIVDLLASLE